MLGQGSNHGAEMDGPNTSGSNIAKRSFPQLYNALFVGDLDNDPNSVSSDDQLPAVLRLREGTGGEFGNLVVVNIGSQGIFQDRCQDESRATGSSPPATGSPDYLWISENTLFSGTSGVNVFETGTCGQVYTTDYGISASDNDFLILLPTSSDENIPFLDPRPTPGGIAFDSVDT
eukprot:scaffold8569_cov1356-Pinguiococcus_pyrenoidosus.AAC.1